MADYNAVQEALAKGADPAMLCGTCPWDRFCVTPPTMTRAQVDAQIEQATRKDEERAVQERASGRDSAPMGGLLTALFFGGRDTTGTLCPVFSLRLRSSGGRAIADSIRQTMTKWDDQS